jgi:hypothetical protein
MAVGMREAVGRGVGEEQDERRKRTERREMRAAYGDLERRRGRRMERIVNENHVPVCMESARRGRLEDVRSDRYGVY